MALPSKLKPLGGFGGKYKKGETLIYLDLKNAVNYNETTSVVFEPEENVDVKIELIGGGGGDGGASGYGIWYGSGGSDAYLSVKTCLKKGVSYQFVCGAMGKWTTGINQGGSTAGSGSSVKSGEKVLFSTSGGLNGIYGNTTGANGGTASVDEENAAAELNGYEVLENIPGNNGNNGGYAYNKAVPSGASVFDGYGKGCDGNAGKNTGTGGFVKVTVI